MLQLIRALFLLTLLFTCALQAEDTRTLLFYGDSLTAAYGIDPEQGYPALIEAKIDQAGLPWQVAVGAVSGDTSAGGLRRIDWMLRRPVDVFVLALGSNDGLRGIPLESTEDNLQAIIDKVRAKNPGVHIVIAGMLMPPNLGPEYTEAFQKLYPRLAKANDATLIPFLLKDVAGHPELNLPDGIHPNPAGQKIIANNAWEYIEPMVQPLQSE